MGSSHGITTQVAPKNGSKSSISSKLRTQREESPMVMSKEDE